VACCNYWENSSPWGCHLARRFFNANAVLIRLGQASKLSGKSRLQFTKTLQGQSVSIAVQSGSAMVNNAKLVATDLDASNGVIHVIDTVIMPPESKQTAVMPHHMIQQAIQEGVPLFNAGHVNECAKVYMTTAKSLLSMENHGMSSHVTTTLQMAVNKAEHCSCSNTQAWTLRHALDSAYSSMQASTR
jgi:transforming growth factor-beta-induced protein